MTTATRRKQIRKEAVQMLQLAKVTEPPVPIERIARMQDVQLRYVPYEGNLSGLLFQENGIVIIGVNVLHSKTRQRFTIAHELGHLVLHNSTELFIDRAFPVRLRNERSSQAIDPVEIDANAFAAELLMPADMLAFDLRGHTDVDYEDDQFLYGLAHRYDVSLQALIFRLHNLGYIHSLEG